MQVSRLDLSQISNCLPTDAPDVSIFFVLPFLCDTRIPSLFTEILPLCRGIRLIHVTSASAPPSTLPFFLEISMLYCLFGVTDYSTPFSFVFSQGSRRGEPLHSEASDFTSRLPPATFRAV